MRVSHEMETACDRGQCSSEKRELGRFLELGGAAYFGSSISDLEWKFLSTVQKGFLESNGLE